MRWVLAVFALLMAWAPVAWAQSALLIHGTIVVQPQIIENGWLAIRGNEIVAVSAERPNIPGARVLDTHDIVFPGFIDLHNHPIYAVFPRWKAPRVFANRYQWRADPAYLNSIQNPEGKLITQHFCDMDAYVELKALMGGTTSILGLYEPADTPTVPECVTGLARNLDWATGFHGPGVGHEKIGNILGVRPNDLKLSAGDVERAKKGELDLVAVHLGEGQRNDPESKAEFAQLKQLGLLNSKTAIIHGVALTGADFAEMKAAGTAFVWSPRSNFELYGETADIGAARRSGVNIVLAPDWSPTGSVNMLGELAYARTVVNRDFPGAITPRFLYEMATSKPANVAKIFDKVGELAQGRRADLFLLRASGDPFEAVTKARPQDVTLTIVDGVPVYGAKDALSAAGLTALDTTLICGEERAVNRTVLPAGGLPGLVERLQKALAGEGLTLAGLAECS